jgi:hypothetical protein
MAAIDSWQRKTCAGDGAWTPSVLKSRAPDWDIGTMSDFLFYTTLLLSTPRSPCRNEIWRLAFGIWMFKLKVIFASDFRDSNSKSYLSRMSKLIQLLTNHGPMVQILVNLLIGTTFVLT